ncbi:MAG: hypothetical protein ACREE5_14520 [Acetobacteraceae bacterium]
MHGRQGRLTAVKRLVRAQWREALAHVVTGGLPEDDPAASSIDNAALCRWTERLLF